MLSVKDGASIVNKEHNSALSRLIRNIDMKYFSLILLVIQNTGLVLAMRYSRVSKGPMYMISTAVLLSEFLKTATCFVVVYFQEGSFGAMAKILNEQIFQDPVGCAKMAVPSLLYVLQNNLLYTALSNLDAATYQVLYQMKILTTALFSVFMLGRKESPLKWLSLLILTLGVTLVQLNMDDSKKKGPILGNPMLGVGCVVVATVTSGFAGVYFEKVLKSSVTSLWVRNIQLGTIGVAIATVSMLMRDAVALQENGFFHGYTSIVWLTIFFHAFGGLTVAAVVKYANSILKGFAAGISIVTACILSIYIFDFVASGQFMFGTALVLGATYLYSLPGERSIFGTVIPAEPKSSGAV